MIEIYGIRNCGSVRKTFALFHEMNVSYEFIDIVKNPPTSKELAEWLKIYDINILLNTKGTTYRKLGLKAMDLNDKQKEEWLLKEPLLFKRPIVLVDSCIHVVGFQVDSLRDIVKKA